MNSMDATSRSLVGIVLIPISVTPADDATVVEFDSEFDPGLLVAPVLPVKPKYSAAL